ncbi:hypothetical protein BGZ61DRAFT_487557 [Ilyonectria robusta]|uniref:uncharacterized protein n=1 Tax=Ilyonectria robusta TaxID=1079257 RepID=UPI001E8E381F|nr:uncharacterized protein BGZ61DRAFT_487557 [Ilyonectria robusta]KAH8651966.1 hypothetical protein BGZ61DRAFT_487557 [Ilyonectria robusta]
MGTADTEASSWAKLNGPSDWKHWIASIRKSATIKDVWDLIDPFKENKDPLALSSIQDRIILTVGNYRDVINDKDDVTKELALLRARIQLATWFHEREVLNRYRTALKGPGRTKTKEWVTSWQKVLTEARNLGLPGSKGLRPTLDFLEAVRPIDLTFADIWMNKIQYKVLKGKADWEAKIPDGIKISELFEKQAADTKAPRGSFATFQGSGSSGSNRSEGLKTPCLCGKQHRYAKCYYLVASIRPAGWKPNQDTEFKINQQLEDPATKQRM